MPNTRHMSVKVHAANTAEIVRRDRRGLGGERKHLAPAMTRRTAREEQPQQGHDDHGCANRRIEMLPDHSGVHSNLLQAKVVLGGGDGRR